MAYKKGLFAFQANRLEQKKVNSKLLSLWPDLGVFTCDACSIWNERSLLDAANADSKDISASCPDDPSRSNFGLLAGDIIGASVCLESSSTQKDTSAFLFSPIFPKLKVI